MCCLYLLVRCCFKVLKGKSEPPQIGAAACGLFNWLCQPLNHHPAPLGVDVPPTGSCLSPDHHSGHWDCIRGSSAFNTHPFLRKLPRCVDILEAWFNYSFITMNRTVTDSTWRRKQGNSCILSLWSEFAGLNDTAKLYILCMRWQSDQVSFSQVDVTMGL